MIVDSGASKNWAPADELENLGKDVAEVQGQQVRSAEAGRAPMRVVNRATMHGSAVVEKGFNKSLSWTFSGVEGFDYWLLSVPELYRQNAEVHFAQPEKGGEKFGSMARKDGSRLSLLTTSIFESRSTQVMTRSSPSGKNRSVILPRIARRRTWISTF